MSLSELLRAQTRLLHEQLHTVVDLKSMLAEKQNYIAALPCYWMAVQPVEHWLKDALNHIAQADCPPDLEIRLQKTDWLEQDLQYLSRSPDWSGPPVSMMLTPPTTEFWQHAQQHRISQIAGAIYVLEGMTLGAMQISSLLKDQLAIDHTNGGRFFAGYQQKTQQLWHDIKSWLNYVGHHSHHCDTAAIDMSQKVFRHFANQLSAAGA